MSTLIQDLKYGLRMLAKNPGFTAVAVLSLALGIGANTSIFTLINGLLLKSLPVHDPQQLVSFGLADGGGIIGGIDAGPLDLFPYDFYRQIESQDEVFDGVCAFGSHRESVRIGLPDSAAGLPEQAIARLVSGNYFSVLGVGATVGRMIAPSDATAPGNSPVAVLSHQYWQRRFASDPGVVGQSITVNGAPYTVIGIAPPGFFGETVDTDPPDMWIPVTMQPQVMLRASLLDPHGLYWMHLIGRRKAGVSRKQMQEWVNLKLRQYMTEQQGTHLTAEDKQTIQQMYVDLLPAGQGISHLRIVYSQPLEILMGVVVLVLLIACANLANLLLARIASREKEIATRLALGAVRSRIIRQVLTETLLLALMGGALGLVFAAWGTQALIGFVASGAQSVPLQSTPDWHVLGFALAASLLTGLLFGLAPALRISRVGLASELRSGSRTMTSGTAKVGGFPLPKVLVASQVALSLLLLIGAGLFIRTLHNLKEQDFGFDRQNVLLVNVDPRNAGYKAAQMTGFNARVLEALNALPGVRSAAISTVPPISGMTWSDSISVEGHTPQPNEDLGSSLNGVGPRYFETVGIRLALGRSIGPQDTATAPKVAVINQTAADYFFPHQNPIGRHFAFDDPAGRQEFEVVGVARDAKYNNPRETPKRMIYPALLQLVGEDQYANWVEVRSVGDPAKVAGEVRRALAQVDPTVPIRKVVPVGQWVDGFIDQEELISDLSGFFALLALLLACIGLYGVMSYNVMRRTNELGIRMALGAQPGGVLWLVLKESLVMLAVGIGVGVPLALAASRLVRAQLFGLSPSDPTTLLAAIASIAVVTLLAGYLPARRATKVDPLVALRYE